MDSDAILAATPHAPPTLDKIAPEIREMILRHLFRGNKIRVTLRTVPIMEESTELVQFTGWREIVCKLEPEKQNILLVNKKVSNEGLVRFYEMSTFCFEVDAMCSPKGEAWARWHLQKINKKILKNIRHVIFDGLFDSNISGTTDLLPALKTIRLPEVRFSTDLVSLRALDDPELFKKIANIDDEKGIVRFSQALANARPAMKISGFVVAVEDNTNAFFPDTHHMHVEFSSGLILSGGKRKQLKTFYQDLLDVLKLSRMVKPGH